MHQIRLQLVARGWPLVGDISYGASSKLSPDLSPDHRAEPIALHARELTFSHPVRYDTVVVRAPVPSDWREFEALGVQEGPPEIGSQMRNDPDGI